MKILKKLTKLKENFKAVYSKPLGKACLLISSIGLGLSLLPFGTIGSISIYLSVLHIVSFLVASMSLLFIIFGPEKIISEDFEINKDMMKKSLAIFGIGVVGIFLNTFADIDLPLIRALNFILVACGFFGLQISSSNVFKQLDKQQENKFEKLPLNLSKNIEDEKELELTNYFKK